MEESDEEQQNNFSASSIHLYVSLTKAAQRPMATFSRPTF
jgi:hypothetical protein